MAINAQIISGDFDRIIVRQRSHAELELGELVVVDVDKKKKHVILLHVSELFYGSQVSQQNLELISGMRLEENEQISFLEPSLRNYKLAVLKPLLSIENNRAQLCKVLPSFFSEVREVAADDLAFLTTPAKPLKLGRLRSGSKTLDVDIFLDGEKVLAHHILVAGTTGRGKSVLLSNLLWNVIDKDYCGCLVLDPHDEYYGRSRPGLRNHPARQNVIYYTPKNVPPGARTLQFHINSIRPDHFSGVLSLSDPQWQCINAYYRKYRSRWIEALLLEKPLDSQFHELTMAVVKRIMLQLLDLEFFETKLLANGIFSFAAGENTVRDICTDLEEARTVIIDTSSFAGNIEILIGSLITTELFTRYRHYKLTGKLQDKPVISIVLEEAPRVLGKEVLQQGSNIFSTIAREGRKFKVGLTAITQLPSLIPREILANMNTKIILGIEMAPERQAIIDSASQDLSSDAHTIASLDVGEAIVTSNFARFALPVKIPHFDEVVKSAPQQKLQSSFSGVNLE